MTSPLHPGLAWLADKPHGRRWLDDLPRLVQECADGWSLRLGDPYAYAYASYVVRVTLADGTPAALKIGWPHREGEHEAAALVHHGGNGAVQLFESDPRRGAMLMERADPGTPLADVPEREALDAIVDLLPRLWVPAGEPFGTLADEASWWAEYLPRVWRNATPTFERRLLDAALDVLTSLPSSQGELVLLHQDLHADNILKSTRQPWLAIDPKPLIGEREFGIAAIVRGDELGRGPDRVRARLDRVTGELALDRERAKLWAFAQTLAWGVDEDEDEILPEHVEVAGWLLDA